MTATQPHIVHTPGAGKAHFDILDGRVVPLAEAEETRGGYDVLQMTFPPHWEGPPPHIHHREEEAWYVLAGELLFEIAGERVRAPAGSFVLVPPGVVHTFSNPSAQPVQWLVIFSPSGMGGYFREIAHHGHDYHTTGLADLVALGQRYQMEVVAPPPGR